MKPISHEPHVHPAGGDPLHPDHAMASRFLADQMHQADEEARTFVIDTVRKAADSHAHRLGDGHIVFSHEDLRQIAIVDALRHLHLYTGHSSLRTWASKCCEHAMLDVVRLMSSKDTASRGGGSVEDDPQIVVGQSDPAHSPAEVVAQHELVEHLQHALAELPPRIRAVILQRLEGRSRLETAKLLGLHRNTVLALDKAGRALLAAKLHLDP